MTPPVDQARFFASVCSPEHEDDAFLLCPDSSNDLIGEALPAAALVAPRLVGPHRQGGVEEQHSLARPGAQVARAPRRDPEIGLQLFEDVDERGRWWHARVHAEAQAVRLTWAVVGVLAEDHHLHVGKGGQVKRGEDVIVGRIHRVRSAFGSNKGLQFGPIRLVEFTPQDRVPVRGRRHPGIVEDGVATPLRPFVLA